MSQSCSSLQLYTRNGEDYGNTNCSTSPGCYFSVSTDANANDDSDPNCYLHANSTARASFHGWQQAVWIPRKEGQRPLLLLTDWAAVSRPLTCHGHQGLYRRVFLIMLLRGEIISNVFLKTRMISSNIYNGLETMFEETPWRYGHIDGELDPILSKDSPLVKEIRDWLEYLKEEDDKVMVNEVRSSTRTGRPCGDDSFISRMDGLLERQLNDFYPAEGVSRNKWSLSLLIRCF